VAQNKTFVFSSIKSFTNGPPASSTQNKYTMMLSYATNFRNDKKSLASTMYSTKEESKKQSLPDPMKRASEQDEFNAEISRFEDGVNSGINYKYNPAFNYAPELQNSDDSSTFFKKKNEVALAINRTTSKSSMRSPLSKTASSFKGVKFRDDVDEKGPLTMKRAETSQNVRVFKNNGI
jgi:hypothetical protein